MHTNPQMKECIDLRACSYSNWYKKFQKITPDSISIPLSDTIVSYLLDEIIILPKECYANNNDDDDDDVEETNENDNDSDGAATVGVHVSIEQNSK